MKIARAIAFILVCVICWNSCVSDDEAGDDLQIDLRWNQGFAGETRHDAFRGLTWCLSFLGAALPSEFLRDSTNWTNDNHFKLKLTDAGFNDNALRSWSLLIQELKNSEEYRVRGAIDVGRFIMLTLNSSNHYYAITGADNTLSEFRNKFKFLEQKGAIVNSSVAFGNRVIEISDADEFHEIAFIAVEGTGSIAEKTFTPNEFETMTLMPNGQLRFALYDTNGNLKTGASTELTAAGKPSKCLWCHEINLSSVLRESPPVVSYFTDLEYNNIIADRVKIIKAHRSALKEGVDFTQTSEHTKGELLYLSFMEPSLERLSLEWGVTTESLQSELASLPTHTNDEFPFLGPSLYSRKDIEKYAPYAVTRVPDEPRNNAGYEPDLIHN